jgi:uncharacterized protein
MNRTFITVCRTVHIYLTMFGLAVMVFFAVTGFTANHEDWFGAAEPKHEAKLEGSTPTELLAKDDRLGVVEHLRKTFRITGAVSGYDVLDDGRVSVGFKEPGAIWEVEIDGSDGTTMGLAKSFNATAVINNLHRGRYSGPAWRWVIDLSAGLIVLACLTGIVLWWVLPKRRKLGVAFLLLGTALAWAVYAVLVPGRDEGVRSEARE